MIEWMLAEVIGKEFELNVGKNQSRTGSALHVGFGMNCGNATDQYEVVHMYIYAPHNYVYVAIQQERIDAGGKRHVGPMEILSYHDSCWQDAIKDWIFKNRATINGFRSFKLFDWRNVIELTEDEQKYLNEADRWRQNRRRGKDEVCPINNPFDERGIWVGKFQF